MAQDAPGRDLGRRLVVAGVVALVVVLVAAVVVLLVHRGGAGFPGSSSGPEPSEPPASDDSPASIPAPAAGKFASVAVGAGGFVTGLSFSDDGRTRLIRTDVGGGYRWDRAADQWELDTDATSLPKADVQPDAKLGVLAVAVAPSDAKRAYMAYHDGVFRSDDGARTWSRVLSGVSTASNDGFRTSGSRLVVDPADPDVVFYGSQLDGMYVTRDAGSSWSRVSTDQVPAGIVVDIKDKATRGDVKRATNTAEKRPHLASAGISAIAVDPTGPVVGGRSQVLYAASYGEGVYKSVDGARTWSRTGPATIRSVNYLRVLGNGDVLATSHEDPVDIKGPSQVWRFDRSTGKWAVSGPHKQANWTKLAADPTRPGQVAMLATSAKLALSSDYGKTWKVVKKRTQSSQGDVPWLAWALNFGTKFMGNGEIVFDPVVKGRLWFAEGTGVWYTDLAHQGPHPEQVTWHSQSRGIEELVPNDVVVPPGGKPLLAAWDRAIFRSDDPQVYPRTYGPVNRFDSAWSLDYSVSDPDYVVATVASQHAPYDPSTSGYSTDGGRSWRAFPTIPDDSTNAIRTFGFGSIAVSGPGDVVWVPSYGKRPQYTTDGGKSWDPITLPGVTDYSLVDNKPYYVTRHVIAADKTKPGTFYLYVDKTGTFRSTDGGRSWALMSDDSAMANTDFGFHVSLKSVPGTEGELFMTPGQLSGTTSQPFLHSSDAGRTWAPVPDLTGVYAFGFGKAFPGSDHAAIYVSGYLKGAYGLYRSTDDARSWTLLTVYPDGRTSRIKAIDGDKDKVGRVYAAVGGAGWVYGDTASIK